MSKTYVIEVRRADANSKAAGIVVKERSGFRFFAADAAFASLDQCVFRSPSEAEKVATRISGASAPPPGWRGRPPAATPVQTQCPHPRRIEGDEHVEH
jgi:hypothetical protein